MALPKCTGEPCRIVEYKIRNFEFRGTIFNVDEPADQWVTTAAGSMSEGARNSWRSIMQTALLQSYADLEQQQSTVCNAPCECGEESILETKWVEARHEHPVNSDGQLKSVGIATYEVQKKTKFGSCLPTETKIAAIQLPKDALVSLGSVTTHQRIS